MSCIINDDVENFRCRATHYSLLSYKLLFFCRFVFIYGCVASSNIEVWGVYIPSFVHNERSLVCMWCSVDANWFFFRFAELLMEFVSLSNSLNLLRAYLYGRYTLCGLEKTVFIICILCVQDTFYVLQPHGYHVCKLTYSQNKISNRF